MTVSAQTQQVIEILVSRWAEARGCESDPVKIAAFDKVIEQAQALLSRDATPDEIEVFAGIVVPYPTWGRQALLDLAAVKRQQVCC